MSDACEMPQEYARRVLLPAMPRDKTETDQLAQLVLWLANLNVHTFLGNLP